MCRNALESRFWKIDFEIWNLESSEALSKLRLFRFCLFASYFFRFCIIDIFRFCFFASCFLDSAL
ncbi:hypothetical protein BKN38_06515 [Helicobacter sp. CLO-3]|uniref:hypothetical protein n=1 Tax=unclassified Helicobacter TaxID=2593540 RepID=UPI000805B3FC|nr:MULTISPECIES: hypothetical protein [unclassified Helicobacter]OBV30059.1 hypothetical protein BA723_02945 [Helicobacter sp. CLO-3]OHU82706.1 hypothetical protein BKN38_06515 [Helicobacter sp. CLO-3]